MDKRHDFSWRDMDVIVHTNYKGVHHGGSSVGGGTVSKLESRHGPQ